MVRFVPVLLVLLSVLREHYLRKHMKAGPRQNEFEPTEGKIVNSVMFMGWMRRRRYVILFLGSILDSCIAFGSDDRKYKTSSPS